MTNQKSQSRAKADDPAQSKLFVQKAREIEADEDKSAADELLGQLAKMRPVPRIKKKERL